MELRYARESDDIAGLWREAFPGDEGTVYFSREFDGADVLVYEDRGQIVSMLHWTRQVMRLWGEDVPCAYIMGVGTRRDYRRGGLAGDLLEQALFELHLRKIPLACLIPAEPALAGYYAKYGFVQAGTRMKAPAQANRYSRASTADIPELNKLYEGLTDGLPRLARPAERWEAIMDEYDVELGRDGEYGVYDRGVWLEGTRGVISGGHPNAACIRIVEVKMIAALAEKNGKPLPGKLCDKYCPWNDSDGEEGSPATEELWFSEEPPYINLLYNGKDAETW